MAILEKYPPYTPEDLLSHPEASRYELVDGTLVERAIGAESSEIGGLLFARLLDFARRTGYGHVFPSDTSYQCFGEDLQKVRLPDVSVVRSGRLPGNRAPKGHITIPPDLAVEVISPNDTASGIQVKVREYLDAGIPLVWVVSPDSRTATVYRQGGEALHLCEDGELDGEDVLPGFRCRLGDVLPPPGEDEGS